MRRTLIVTALFGIFFIGLPIAQSATTTSISQWGVTWHFDKAYEHGQFANGDYWVLGPVTINRITPDFTGSANGWEVNPSVGTHHGFDAGCKGGRFDSSKVPSLPYTTQASVESIVKVISTGSAQPCVKTAVVLTVVDEIPANNGSTVFRPPYVGTNKPFYNVGDLRTDLLPTYQAVGSPPTLSTVEGYFEYFRLEHLTSPVLRDLRPSDAMQNYNPKNQPNNHETLLRLMLNDSIEDKRPALIKYVQHGIDKCHAIIDGWVIRSADGHDPGHRIIAAFAATMLDITAAKTALNNATGFHEDYYVFTGENGPLWGEPTTEKQYWDYIRGLGGSRSRKDPYGYIDGGKCGADYQLIVSQSWKGSILATQLMPSLINAWNSTKLAITTDYAERWVETGTWATPDPCAPVSGTYGVHYGPDGSGGCIRGSGRFPQRNGSSKDAGQYQSEFVRAMWNAYWDQDYQDGTPSILAPTGLQVIR